jgi:hypothetical protein
MKNIFLGKHWFTTIAGYVASGLIAWQEINKAGDTNTTNIIIAVAIAVLGRASADAYRVD